jgi:hypothetical protein
MTKVLVKNGQDAERVALFKRVRDNLTEDEQRELATLLQLEVTTAVLEIPTIKKYLVDYTTEVEVEASSEEEALEKAKERISSLEIHDHEKYDIIGFEEIEGD